MKKLVHLLIICAFNTCIEASHPSLDSIKFLENHNQVISNDETFQYSFDSEESPDDFKGHGQFTVTDNFLYSSTRQIHIQRRSTCVNVSAPYSDQWEVFGEADKKRLMNSTHFRIMGGVQLKW